MSRGRKANEEIDQLRSTIVDYKTKLLQLEEKTLYYKDTMEHAFDQAKKCDKAAIRERKLRLRLCKELIQLRGLIERYEYHDRSSSLRNKTQGV